MSGAVYGEHTEWFHVYRRFAIMAKITAIEWAEATWQPITGCSVVSPGCTNCYAMRLAGTRMKHHPSRAGLTQESKTGPVWNGTVRFNEQWLDQPLRWKKPRRIFVCAHGDLFHESVPDEWIDRVFAIMALAPQHTFLVLTKRPERMRAYGNSLGRHHESDRVSLAAKAMKVNRGFHWDIGDIGWHLPNVHLGVSVEDQQRADERIPYLLATPAAKRFILAEPLLGPIEISRWLGDSPDETGLSEGAGIEWVIVGGESGPGARPLNIDWARSLIDQCREAEVACFVKQLGANPWFGSRQYGPGSGRYIKDKKGGDWSQWPEDLRVREIPA
jgi:protein gp37